MRCVRPSCRRRADERAGLCRPHYLSSPDHGYYPDPDAVRAHLRALHDAGWSWRQISRAAGIPASTTTAQSIARGITGRVQVGTAKKFLAVTEPGMRRRRLVPVIGSRRRLRALVAIGWTQDDLAARLGIRKADVSRYTSGSREGITAETAARVTGLYDELWDQPGPSRLAAARARNRGWAVPLAWDDDTIDDPDAAPNTGHHLSLRAGNREDIAARRRRVRYLTACGLSAAEIADRLDVAERTVERDRAS